MHRIAELDELTARMYLKYHHCWASRTWDEDGEGEDELMSPVYSEDWENSSNTLVDHGQSTFSNKGCSSPRSSVSVNVSIAGPAPGPHAIPVMWDGLERNPIVYDEESVLGTASMSISEEY